DQPPPPKLQVREPVIDTTAPPPPVTLNIEPTKKEDRVEYAGPPVIVPGPPPPPAPPAPVRPSVITNPDWVRRPSGADLARFYPERALERGISGSATVQGVVQENGRVTNCTIVEEDPAGQGFGRATVQLCSRFQMRPQTRDGAPVGGARVNIPIRWQVPE
ncbi:energy transducer TonB, partial [Brevundimonas sp.]